ncbi:carboxylesterase family protein [Sphingobacterium sp. MYb382]|uniref:carboxylesterase family protein n=1 Tax=Sphingobacterium sp. MYb382 TaxID=2745278 RepID=UPI00309E9C1D
MSLKTIRSLFILPLFLVVIFAKGQTHFVDKTVVDSLSFAQVRSVINVLPTDLFEKHIYKQGDKELPYRLLLPKNYKKGEKYPLVITLHNSSRIGNDNEKQLEHLAKIWTRPEIYSTYNALVVVPQFNERSSLYDKDANGILVSKASDDVQLVLDLLSELEHDYRIDRAKVYLVGYSMGASTAQNLMNMAPNKFTGIVSIAAVPDFSNLTAWKVKRILLVHGEKDTDNPYQGSEELFAKLKGRKNVTFKTYTNLNHATITIPFLLNDEIPNWLFKKR